MEMFSQETKWFALSQRFWTYQLAYSVSPKTQPLFRFSDVDLGNMNSNAQKLATFHSK